ncbi:MAG: PAS domain S-box protein, partial [Eubacteriales bacterium]|nr:PAS domain S-box protein [Eubacteriales bacterium]
IEINKQLLIDGKETDFWFKANVCPVMVADDINVIITLFDITEKKKEELSIIKSMDFCKNILDQIPVIVWRTNADLECEYVNMELERFTGIVIEGSLGDGLKRAVHSDDFEMYRKALNEANKKRKPFQIEARLRRHDGEFRHCLISGTPYYDVDGQFGGYIGTDLDITESKKTTETLNRYHTLAETTNDIILFIDMDGRIIDANNAAVEEYGYTYEELCSINIRDIRNNWGYTKNQMEIANKEEVRFETVHRRKDGSYFDAEVSSRGTDMDGRRILTSIVRNISARKRAERKLQEQEALFRTVFEQSPIGMAFSKSDGEIVEANPVYEKFFGRQIEELRQLGWKKLIHPDDLNKNIEELNRYAAGEIDRFSEIKRYIRPDGSIIWGSLTLTPLLDEKRNPRLSLSMIEDITERIHSEQNLKESERSKSVLLSNLPGMAYRCNYDKDWTMQFVSDGCFELTGYRPEDLLGNKVLSYNDLINDEYQNYLWEKWAQLLPIKGVLKEEYSITTSTGETKWVYEQGRGIYDENNAVIALEGLVIDITDRKKKEEEIRFLNYHDTLTGLFNRRFFEEKKKQLDTASQLPLSVIIADINGLKQINDALGHAQGDKLIVAISKILKEYMRHQDILARTSGDDFTILMPHTNIEEADNIMKLIEKACDENKTNEIYHTSISLGCATKNDIYEDINDILKLAEDNMYQQKLLKKESSHSSIIASLKASLFEKSQETEQHAQRLIILSKAIGQRLNLSDKLLNELELLSTLHDIGKIGVKDAILNKTGKLIQEEWVVMKKHPEIGYRIAISIPDLKPIAKYILSHHERYDGKGYPKGLKGEDIPLLSRIIAIVDAYDAMTENRAYRKAISKEAAILEIERNSGTQFDPSIAKIFIDILSENKR